MLVCPAPPGPPTSLTEHSSGLSILSWRVLQLSLICHRMKEMKEEKKWAERARERIWWKTELGKRGKEKKGGWRRNERGKKGWKTQFSCCMTDSLPANQGLSFNTQKPSCGFSTIAHGAKLTTSLPRCLLYCIAHTLHVHTLVCACVCERPSAHMHARACWTAASVMQRSVQWDLHVLICQHPGDGWNRGLDFTMWGTRGHKQRRKHPTVQ